MSVSSKCPSSTDLRVWTPLATTVLYTNTVSIADISSAPARFFRAVADRFSNFDRKLLEVSSPAIQSKFVLW